MSVDEGRHLGGNKKHRRWYQRQKWKVRRIYLLHLEILLVLPRSSKNSEDRVWSQAAYELILVTLLTSPVTLDNLLSFPKLLFPYL